MPAWTPGTVCDSTLSVYARCVHVRQPVLGELQEPAFDVRDGAFAEHDSAIASGGKPLLCQLRNGEVFIQGDVSHSG